MLGLVQRVEGILFARRDGWHSRKNRSSRNRGGRSCEQRCDHLGFASCGITGSRGNGRCGRGHRLFGGFTDEIRDARIRFESGQQLRAGGQIVIHLTFVVSPLAFALSEDHVAQGLGIRVGDRLGVRFTDFLNTQLAGGFRQALVDHAVDLLAVVARIFALARLEPLAMLAFGMRVELLEQVLGLRLPCHTAMLGDFPRGLLVDHGTFQTGKRGIHLGDHIAALDQFEGDVLNIMLGELRALTFIQHVRTFKESIHLFRIVAPLSLRGMSDSRCVLLGFRFLCHWRSTSCYTY